MKTRIILCALSLCLATALFAHTGVKDPDVLKRMHTMKLVADDMKALNGIAKDPVFDTARVAPLAASLLDHARNIEPSFKLKASDPKSEARETIWTDWDGFLKSAAAMESAVEALTKVETADEFQAAFTALGGTCTACHEVYRIKN